ncbi:DUF3987 domain-containing protein [Moraxella osloensis]|nr:DUF3987 domain-containing protein [Moraxella osloensis]MBW4009136.1 DUF3987 domain-containing protein [Moraxella osloensis]
MNNLAIPTNEKAHTDNGMDFLTFISDFKTASQDAIQHNQALTNLAVLLSDDKLKFINSNIDVDGQPQPTDNSIATVLYNQHYQPSNLVIFPLDNREPFLLHGFNNDGFIFGNGGQVVAIRDLTIAMIVAIYTKTRGENYTVITPLNTWHFDSLVKAHASQSQVMILTDYEHGKEYERTFKGDNVKIVSIVDLIDDLIIEQCIDDILTLSDTKVIELNGIEWGELEPLEDTNTPATRYPIEAWQGVLRQAVEAIAYHAQVPTAMAGQCILGALSTIGQRYINAPMGHEHKPACLYLITEGESGSGKTFASKLSHYSIKQWDKNAYQVFLTLLREWQADLDSLKGKEKAEYIKDTPKPKNNTILVTDATIEAVLDKFIIDELANLSWTTDEAGQFFNGHTMKSDTAGNALSSLTKLWSDGEASRLRSQRGKTAVPQTNAYDARLTLDIMGQRVILEPALTDPVMNGQGFLARSLIACPDSLQGQRVWNTAERMSQSPYDDPRLLAYWTRCDILLEPPPNQQQPLDEAGKPIRVNMPFGDVARQALADYQQSIEHRQAKGRTLEYLKAFASRMAENATRIASLMAFFDNRQAVEVNDLQRAFKLVEYSTAERLRYLDIKAHEKSDSQKLIDWLVKQCKTKGVKRLSYAEAQSKVSVRALRRKAEFELAISLLTDKGYIQVTTQDNSRFIEINPQALN